MQDYHNLRSWCLANELAGRVTDIFPLHGARKATGTRGQAIRAAQSIAANLAEGCERSTRGEFLVFIDVAIGSATELENHLGAALQAGVIDAVVHKGVNDKLIALGKMLRALKQAVEHALALEQNAKR